MPASSLEDIFEILDCRRSCCRELLELSRQQNRVIHTSDYSHLLSILGQKQQILGRLDEIRRRHPELGRQWSTLRASGAPAARSRCEAVIAETESILAELLQTEKQGAEQLCQRRDATRRQLECVTNGIHVNETYRDSDAPVNHRFLNVNQ